MSNTFETLGLSDPVIKAISEMGFKTPSEIQAQAIPQLLTENKDFIGLAQTGTGKTAAFGLPLIEKVVPSDKFTQALILAPTRELGQQIAQQLALFGKNLPKLKMLAVYGGASITTQMQALRKGQHIIIATPGRLIDLIQRKAIHLSQLRYLILDEADEMLNMGFKQDIDKILSYTPDEKRVWLFSATMSPDIRKIVRTYMDHPLEVKLNARNEVNTNIEHQFTVVRQADKTEALTRFLDIDPEIRGVVFCRTRRDTQKLADQLVKKEYKADAIHGDLSQRQRDSVMNRFKAHELQLLIATDVAARGIDVNDLSHVFHFTLPEDIPYYTHRSGRTARAGKKGISLAFIGGGEKYKINRIQKQLGISFEKVSVPKSSEIYSLRIESWCLDILEQAPKGKVEPELLEKANIIFGNLSKEELVAKMVTLELEKLNLTQSLDLNEALSKPPKKEKRGYNRGGKGGRGGRGGRARSYPKSEFKAGKKRRQRNRRK
ncbi:MAG: DEAD/DEAH box helicase [Bacteroidota bacterium]